MTNDNSSHNTSLVMPKIVTIAPPCGPKYAGDESGATNGTMRQPEAVTGHSLGGLGHEDDDRHDY